MKARPLALVLALAASIAAPAAQAQSYPAGPVKIIVGTGPGASPDVICRVVADQLARLWGQQVVVLNQPGAGGAIAIRAAGNAAPDGGTLYFALASNFVALPELQATFPFDVARDFVPIGYVGEHPMVIGATPALGVGTLPEHRARQAPAGRTQHRRRQPRQRAPPHRRTAAQHHRHRCDPGELSGRAAGHGRHPRRPRARDRRRGVRARRLDPRRLDQAAGGRFRAAPGRFSRPADRGRDAAGL